MIPEPSPDTAVDIAVIGAGPAGLAAACACQDHNLSYVLLDRRGLAQSFTEYPDTLRFFSPPDEMEIAGVPLPVAGGEKPTRQQYLAYLRGVVRARGLTLSTWETVCACRTCDDGTFVLETVPTSAAERGRRIHAGNVVLAVGLWHEPVSLGVPGSQRPTVFSTLHDPTPFCQHDVLVVGNGNSALGAALSLVEAGARVSLSTRRPPKSYRCGVRPFVKRNLDFAVDERKLALYDNTLVTEIGAFHATLQPVEYIGEDDLSEGSSKDYRPAGEPFSVPCRFVFTLLGHRPDTAFLHDVTGLELRGDGRPVCNTETWETSVPGIYAAGSVAHPDIDIVLRLREQAASVVEGIAKHLK